MIGENYSICILRDIARKGELNLRVLCCVGDADRSGAREQGQAGQRNHDSPSERARAGQLTAQGRMQSGWSINGWLAGWMDGGTNGRTDIRWMNWWMGGLSNGRFLREKVMASFQNLKDEPDEKVYKRINQYWHYFIFFAIDDFYSWHVWSSNLYPILLLQEGVLQMMLVMARSDEYIQQLVASEAIIAAASKKKDATAIVTQESITIMGSKFDYSSDKI